MFSFVFPEVILVLLLKRIKMKSILCKGTQRAQDPDLVPDFNSYSYSDPSPIPGTKPNIRKSHICGCLLHCSCGFQSFAVRECVCLCVVVFMVGCGAKSFAYAFMHAYLAAATNSAFTFAFWTCHTIYVCAKYGATSQFFLPLGVL